MRDLFVGTYFQLLLEPFFMVQFSVTLNLRFFFFEVTRVGGSRVVLSHK